MSIIKVNKVETTSVAGGVMPPLETYGFVISVHSETDEFNFVGNIDLDTSLLSESDATIVSDFIALVKAQLAAS